jgi:hypothetical protein
VFFFFFFFFSFWESFIRGEGVHFFFFFIVSINIIDESIRLLFETAREKF